MWTLILTMIVYHGGTSVQHIDFATQGSCNNAKVAWLAAQSPSTLEGWGVKATAVCVEHD